MQEDAREIPMAAAVVRLTRELWEPLRKSGHGVLFAEFEREYQAVLRENSNRPSDKRSLISDKRGVVMLPDKLCGIYLDICRILDVDPYDGAVGEDL